MKIRLAGALVALVAVVATLLQVTGAPADAHQPDVAAGLTLGDQALAEPTPDRADAWGVTIGTNEYDTLDPLQVAVADADATDRQLGALGIPASHRLALRDGDATAAKIRGAIAWLTDHTGADDTAVLFIAGHATNLRQGRHAIQTTDGLQISDVELAQLLSPIQGRLWIIMATCYGGGFDELLAPGRILTAASDADSVAYENLDIGYSYLVHYLINDQLASAKSLNTNTINDSFDAAQAEIARQFPDRLPIQLSGL